MAFLVDPLVSALFKRLFEILGSDEVRDFASQLVGGVDSELKKLETKLKMIGNLLDRAGDKQPMDESLKEWLDNLQHWAYDAEDLLDEFAYRALRHKLKGEHRASSSKGFRCLPACFPDPLFNVNIGSKIKGINRRLEQLRLQRSTEIDLQKLSGVTSSNATLQRPEESSSVQPENFIYGRDEDKAKLVAMVKSDLPSGNRFRVIAIVGMGGLGKTTIAREVYNHREPEGFEFEEKAWVCVSINFDILTISKSLLGSLKGPSFPIPGDLNGVQVELQKAVSGKKFMIVVDDVWKVKYNDWEKLTSPFKAGAPGSTMIVTTRHEEVAETIRCSDSTYHLQLLSEEACMSLFQEHAFATGTTTYTDQITDKIYEKVIERCSGLPLAAKTLGSLLHSKPINTWENILDSEMWNSSKENDILPVLKLSYLYLPSRLKQCFAYCAIFPQDYEFEEMELVLLWMAEGIIQPYDERFDKTGQYFHDLCSRSLLQKTSSNNFKYVMHDLVHNLAESVFKEFSFRSDQGIIKLPKSIERVRHLSYILHRSHVHGHFQGKESFLGLEKLLSLRTFLPVIMGPSTNFIHCISAKVIFDFLPKLIKLRVLSLERYHITHLPDSIGDLMFLRYLNFSYTQIKSLPESISQLYNLQTLLLKGCYNLVRLPLNMRYITKLCHLDINGVYLLNEMPSGMKELKNLRMLSNFIVGKESSSNLEDLKSLNFLKGVLHISQLENVKQISGLILNNKKDLKVLLLEWGRDFDGSREEREETDVLEMLKPHSNLEELTIRFYGGLKFPSWLTTCSSLSKLTVLALHGCENCTNLLLQSLLSSLKELTIEGMRKLERIDMQIPFKSLEILCFENLQKCQYWDTKGENENVEKFPKLRKLSVIRCPELSVELLDHLPSLEELVIEQCAKLTVSFSSFPKLTSLRIVHCKKVVPTSSSTDEFMSLNSESLPNSADAEVENWLRQNFSCVEKPLKWSDSLAYLEKLFIRNCSISFLNAIYLPNLNDLEICYCEALKSLPKSLKQSKIERLAIYDCVSFLSIGKSTLPLSLKRLSISNCQKLQHLEGISSTFLEQLEIDCCESLTRLSARGLLPNTLKTLWVTDCSNFTTLSPRSWCVHKTLEELGIMNCPRLKSIEEALSNSPCLKWIILEGLRNLEMFSLQNLIGLQDLRMTNNLVSLLIEGVPPSLSDLDIIGDAQMSEKLIRWGLHNLTSLKSLCIKGFEDPNLILSEDQRMPLSLESLVIYNLAPFTSISNLGTLTSLRDLEIRNSNFNSISDLGSLVSLKSFRILNCPELKSIACLGSLTSLQTLEIWSCPELNSIASLGSLTSLQTLRIESCPKLNSIACLGSLTALQTFWINSCPELKSIACLASLTSLQTLEIQSFPKLKSVACLGSLTSLRTLRIESCPKLKSIACLGSLTSLQALWIQSCPKLKFLPSLPASLIKLSISQCPLLKRHWGKGKGKYCKMIAHIPCVYIDSNSFSIQRSKNGVELIEFKAWSQIIIFVSFKMIIKETYDNGTFAW